MRKGYLLVEIVVVLAVIALLSVPMAKISKTIMYEIPQSYKIANSADNLRIAVNQLQKDINNAVDFPDSYKSFRAEQDTLTIQLPDKYICYQLKEDKLIRFEPAAATENQKNAQYWPAPRAKIQWRVLEKDNNPYALAVKTCIEQKRGNYTEKKMKNAYLFFVGADLEPIK